MTKNAPLIIGGIVGTGVIVALASRASASMIRPRVEYIPPAIPNRPALPPRPPGKLGLLEPTTLDKYAQLVAALLTYNIRLVTGRTRATIAEEKKHYAAGRSSIKSGITWHVLGRAIDAYPVDPATGKADMKGANIELYRTLHREWAKLGGHGLAFLPYPEGPTRTLRRADGKTFVDLGHLEYHGPYSSLAEAYAAEKSTVIA